MIQKRITREIIGGATTFFTMAYIIVVNPSILAAPGTGMSHSGVLTATILLCASMTILMGLYAKLPYAIAPGMGINAFFAFTVILGQGLAWQTALGVVFWAGILFLIISLTPLREMIAQAIPFNLRIGTAAGIGIFLTFLGLKNAGIVIADPITIVKMGALKEPALFTVIGTACSLWLLKREHPFAYISSIILVTLLGLFLGEVYIPESLVSTPDFSTTFFKLDIWGALELSLIPIIISLLFTDLFDSLSTFVGVSHATGLVDKNGNPKNMRQALLVDSLATLFAGLFGTSSGTTFIESAAGIKAGAQTGLSSVITGLMFLPWLFFAPLISMIPIYATSPVLILVGASMFHSITELKSPNLEDRIPPFLTLILIPLTFSITQGILWGFIAHTGLYFMAGRRKELHPLMIFLALLSICLIFMSTLMA